MNYIWGLQFKTENAFMAFESTAIVKIPEVIVGKEL